MACFACFFANAPIVWFITFSVCFCLHFCLALDSKSSIGCPPHSTSYPVRNYQGEKFLVLKRQYFTPIDGNGNPKQSQPTYGLPPLLGLPLPNQNQTMHGNNLQQPLGPGVNMNNAPQGYHPTSQLTNSNYSRRQNSQSQMQPLYGSQFSLSSNYMDPYSSNSNGNPTTAPYPPPTNQNNPPGSTPNFYPASHFSQQQQHKISPPQHLPLQNINMQQPIYGSSSDFPPEYGLPTVPLSNANALLTSPPRRYVSPQNSYGSNTRGSPSSRAPPPYRPPPPAARFVTATSPSGGMHNFSSSSPGGISRRSSMTAVGGIPYHRTHSVPGTTVGMGGGPTSYYSTASTQNINSLMDPLGPGMFQSHRSASGFVLNIFYYPFFNFVLGGCVSLCRCQALLSSAWSKYRNGCCSCTIFCRV